ncbi:hypothetical protein [Streptomyces sp. NPDC005989]|uniref:hypothetical protein n=1 Tax=Streptomyces sp. NPDC005989 TaxID=3156727 RepID=UPI00340C3203
MAHEPENRPGTEVATEPEVADLEGVHPSTQEPASSSAGSGHQGREAPDLPDPVDGHAQPGPAQVNDVQTAQADLDAANAAAQGTEESSDDTPNPDDLESDGVVPTDGTAPPLEADGDADEENDTPFAPLDGLDTSLGNDNSADQEDQASDRIQTAEASETGEDEPLGPSLKGDGEEGSGVIGDHTDSDKAAHTQDTKTAADRTNPGTQPHEADEASSPQGGSLTEDEDSPSPQDSAADGDADEDSKPTQEKSLQKELVPEHRIEPVVAMEVSESRDTSAPVVEEEPAPTPSEPAETTSAPDLPEPQTAGGERKSRPGTEVEPENNPGLTVPTDAPDLPDPKTGSHEPENQPGTEVQHEPENRPKTEVATESEATDREGGRPSTHEVVPSSAGAGHQDREAPDLPDPVADPVQDDPAQASDAQNSHSRSRDNTEDGASDSTIDADGRNPIDATGATDTEESGRNLPQEIPGDGRPIHSRYPDGSPVYEGEQPGKIRRPDPEATGPHTVIQRDAVNDRVYKAREYDDDGNPVRDIDFTHPTFRSGRPRPDHSTPEEHLYIPNIPGNPQAGFKRGKGQPLRLEAE